ncbi:MAG: hypothetical protein J0I20_30890 [Chloroflexi bacterium]|nr:hypothetical protein [Chloroflexota bacterium]OJV94185.1 MAG: hypothetical protein BGO39_12025 [Chloroflexi bacterium 54-19]
MSQPNDANRYQQFNNQPQPPVPYQPNPMANRQAEYWPPPPGFPPNYTGWGVSAGPATVKPQKKPITWPLVIGIICLVIALFGILGAFSSHDADRRTLDLDSAAKPLIETGTGNISSSGDGVNDFNMTVNGKTLKLTEVIYYGVDGDISASSATAPYYILAAYLPNTRQVVESQIYDKQGGKLLANFTDFPDASGSYKPSLRERYDDVATSFNLTLFMMGVLVLIAGWCGWIVVKRLRA